MYLNRCISLASLVLRRSDAGAADMSRAKLKKFIAIKLTKIISNNCQSHLNRFFKSDGLNDINNCI